ncbi:MAG: hypothetical protein EA349_01420 [Halomonadaceae bacterium]|nr:MAG: hypothetical protein EA349_01420 [Halomonadaceae bacterium]
MQFAHYWLPEEAVEEEELAEYADSLKQNVSTWLTASLAETAKVTVMFSGGEDSRALINLLPAGPEYQLKTIVDGVNREYRLAQRSARKLGYPVKLIERPMGHYSQDIVEKVLWAGAGLDVRHYHIFNKTADIVGDSAALVGGLGSDKLFKSLFMNNVGNKQKTGFLPETLLSEYGLVPTNIGLPKDLGWLNQPLQDAVWQRRTAHHEKILTFRPRTAGNWHTLWPLGWHSPGHSQFLNNMRFGPRVVEPFIASRNYRLAARIPEKYKIDRKLFNAAFLPLMGAASWVPTTSGRVPAITGVNGRAVQFCIKSWRVMLDELLKYISKEKYISQGPWGNDHKYFLVKSPEDVLGKERADMLNDLIGKITIGKSAELFWQQSGKSAQERKVLSLQVGALFNASSNLLRNEKFSQSFRLSADTT